METTHSVPTYNESGGLRSRFLAEFVLEAEPPYEAGHTPRGRRRIVYLKKGRFHGPRLNGIVVPGGGDCALVRPDGVLEADVRLLLRCDDDAYIYMTYRGLWHAEADVFQRLLRREAGIGEDQYYFRTAIFFETGHPKYEWLNRILAVGIGTPVPESAASVRYRTYEVE